jgi:hypothetical protein
MLRREILNYMESVTPLSFKHDPGVLLLAHLASDVLCLQSSGPKEKIRNRQISGDGCHVEGGSSVGVGGVYRDLVFVFEKKLKD